MIDLVDVGGDEGEEGGQQYLGNLHTLLLSSPNNEIKILLQVYNTPVLTLDFAQKYIAHVWIEE